ncbi:transcription antitermination factor NusG [Mariniflexile fucanivorans]|uniref:Transcription antitermination factor NusG n=1 Tax=Mariniflexile fucanivorans TaxID=264023 RepID=A0A4R1RAR6_9FLAO|nr:UpxY family transcription antiterminator [Mariniflexile fucanivorans]TCL62864.1 transcription antitermination factor NusG [Mariniflexile fucanivorans]
MKSSTPQHWHVLYTKHRHEKKVEQLLQEKNIEVFLPMIKTIRIWSDRKKKILTPLFARYIFVKVHSKKDFYDALSTDGVIKSVKFGSDYAMVRANEIFQIKQLLNLEEASDIKVENHLPRSGQKMKICYGPLIGLDCEVVNANNKCKVVVRIESIQNYITAHLPSLYLEPKTFIGNS